MPSTRSSGGPKPRVVKRRLADGSIREYEYARKTTPRVRNSPDSMGALIIAYRMSPEFLSLAATTKRNYGYYLRDLEELSDQPVIAVRRKELLNMRDAVATVRGSGAANAFMATTATLFRWALDRDWAEYSPAAKVKALKGGHLPPWTAEEADRAIATLPEEFVRVVILARYTGQRRADLVAMTWHAYDGTSIRVRQQKGAARDASTMTMVIPVHHVLKAALDEWKKDAKSTHILTTAKGLPWKANYLTQTMNWVLPKNGFRGELNVHGLRKLAASSLAEAGCSAHEIAAITGHQTLAMVQLYTKSADQERLAKGAIIRLSDATRRLKGG